MSVTYHPEKTRGFRNMGWIKLYQSFNPNQPPAPDRRHFGNLVIFDNGIIAPGGQGFGMHPHQNMEIVSVVISGAMVHSDTAGHQGVNLENAVQLISAGTGIQHSEFNHSSSREIDNLQIWFLPKVNNITPRYQTLVSPPESRDQKLQLLVSPNGENGSRLINQDAWLWRGTFGKGQEFAYRRLQEGNGLYVYVIEGSATVAGHALGYRDAVGLTDVAELRVQFGEDTDLLLIEVSMTAS